MDMTLKPAPALSGAVATAELNGVRLYVWRSHPPRPSYYLTTSSRPDLACMVALPAPGYGPDGCYHFASKRALSEALQAL